MSISRNDENSSAKVIFNYLYERSEKICRSDAVIGFGHFDLKVPRRCGELLQEGKTECIIFTGGIGAGTGDLGKEEAIAFQEELKRKFPEIPDEKVVIEKESKNTLENVIKVKKILNAMKKHKNVKTAILTANAYRQRRVNLTFRKHLPEIKVFNAPPVTGFEKEKELFESKGIPFMRTLLGEIKRIELYAKKGDILYEPFPSDVIRAYRILCRKED